MLRCCLFAVLLLPTAALAQERAEPLFVRALTELQLDQPERALPLLQEVSRLRPDDPAVLASLAEAYEALGDLGAAQLHAAEALRLTPDEPSLYALLADLQLRSGDPSASVATLERLLERRPTDVETLSRAARLQQQTGRLADALATYERLLDVVGESASVRGRMLAIHRRTGDLDGIARTLQALIDLDPFAEGLHRELAEVHRARGDEAAATAALEDWLERHPSDAEALVHLVEAYRRQGDEARAEALLARVTQAAQSAESMVRRAAALYVQQAENPAAGPQARALLEQAAEAGRLPLEGLLMLGDLRFQAGAFAGAANALAEALSIDPVHPEAWAQLAAAYLYAGEARMAADVAEDGLLLFPGQYPLLRASVFILTELGRTREALARTRDALEALDDVDPDNAAERSTVLAAAALLHQRLGDASASDAAYAEALALDPANAMALNNLAYTLATRGERLGEALDLARRAVAEDGDNPAFLDTLGWVYFQQHRYDDAAQWLSRAVDRAEAQGRPSAVLYEHLGEAEAARGRTAEARRHWQRALELDPDRTHLERRLAE